MAARRARLDADRAWARALRAVYGVSLSSIDGPHIYRSGGRACLVARIGPQARREEFLAYMREPSHKSDRTGWSTPLALLRKLQDTLPAKARPAPGDLGTEVRTWRPSGLASVVDIEVRAERFATVSDVLEGVLEAWPTVVRAQKRSPGWRRYRGTRLGAGIGDAKEARFEELVAVLDGSRTLTDAADRIAAMRTTDPRSEARQLRRLVARALADS